MCGGGSYLVSLAMTFILKKIAEEFGPDVIISPSLRENPLFDYYFVFKESNRSKLYEKVCNKVSEIRNLIECSKERARKFSKYSLIPNIAVLVLPAKYKEKGIEEVIKRLCCKALDDLSNNIRDGLVEFLKKFKEASVEYLDIEEDANYAELVENQIKDRLTPKIAAIKASDIKNIDKLKNELSGTDLIEEVETILKVSSQDVHHVELMASMFHILEILTRYKLESRVHEYRAIPEKSDLCDTCGEREYVFELTNTKPSGNKKVTRVCGICFVKRYLDKILGEVESENAIKIKFLSHTDISLKGFIRDLKQVLEDLLNENVLSDSLCIKRVDQGKSKRVIKSIKRDEHTERLLKKLRSEIEEIISNYRLDTKLDSFFEEFETKLDDAIEKCYEFDTEEIIEYLTGEKIEEELLIFNKSTNLELVDYVKCLKEILETLMSNEYKPLIRDTFGTTIDDLVESMKFFAIIKGDGDSIGALLSRKIIIKDNTKGYAP